MSKTAIRKIQDKIITKVFVDRLEEFVAMWQRESSEKPFDEFLLEVELGDSKLKAVKKAMFQSFHRVVRIHVDLWRASESKKPFDEFLLEAKHGIKNNKKEV